MFFAPLSAAASQAMTNLVDSAAARAAFADYTNNVLRIEQVDPSEWNAAKPRQIVDRLPFNMPFQLVVGPKDEDRKTAVLAQETVTTSMPAHVRTYFERHQLMAPLLQWLFRGCKPDVTNEATYLSGKAHPAVWQAADFDFSRLSESARNLVSNSIPMMAVLRPVYEDYKINPIRRAEPLVDYSDSRPEEVYSFPFSLAIVLRAPERRRKFRILATGWPFSGNYVSFKCVSATLYGVQSRFIREHNWDAPWEKGFIDLTLNWDGALRRDVLVFARYGDGPWGPPSIISFYRIPNENRQYDREGRIQSIEYRASADVIPQLYRNKPWKDFYEYDSLGNLIGFLRTRAGQFQKERFFTPAEFVVETYPSDMPKLTNKVRYFMSSADPLTLNYEITDEEIHHSSRVFTSRDRGEFPPSLPKRKR